MRILISSSKNENLLAPQYYHCLKSMGTDIHATYFFDELTSYLDKSKLNKVIFKLYKKHIYKKCNQILLRDCEKIKPNVVLIFKGMEIFPETLDKLKKKNIFLVNYNLDHPFEYISEASGNKNVKESILKYDLHLTYSNHILKSFKDKFPSAKIEFLPFGISNDIPPMKKIQEEIKACFIGYGDKERARMISMILKNNIDIDVYGLNWQKYFDTENAHLSIYPPVYGKNYWHTLTKYRAQLNLLRKHNFLSHNMRSFEIPASGGIMLSERTPEHLSFFSENIEAFYYSSEDEMIIKLNDLLKMTSSEANKIRSNAIERCQNSNYSYSDRAQEVLDLINSYFIK